MKPRPGRQPLYLKPGEWFFGHNRGVIETILGSCVSVTMFHRDTGCAGICHAVIPVCTKKPGCSPFCETSSKYADCVVGRMAKMFFHGGIKPRNVEVKLFGGSDTLTREAGDSARPSVGSRNIEEARKSLENEGLILKVSDVGGFEGRKLLFDTNTGEVMVKRLGGTGIYRISDSQG